MSEQLSFPIYVSVCAKPPPRRKNGKYCVVWNLVPLGVANDTEVAKRFGLTAATVRNERIRRGIPASPVPPASYRSVITDDLVLRYQEAMNAGTLCECGSRMPWGAAACERCDYLDGLSLPPSAQEVVSAMRILGRATWEDLLAELPRYSRRSIERGIAALVASGRLRRVNERDPDHGHSEEFAEFELVESRCRTVSRQ